MVGTEEKKEKDGCPRCDGELRSGDALQNTRNYGAPDFYGQKDLVGQTFTMNGPARQIKVQKCERCGYSRT